MSKQDPNDQADSQSCPKPYVFFKDDSPKCSWSGVPIEFNAGRYGRDEFENGGPIQIKRTLIQSYIEDGRLILSFNPFEEDFQRRSPEYGYITLSEDNADAALNLALFILAPLKAKLTEEQLADLMSNLGKRLKAVPSENEWLTEWSSKSIKPQSSDPISSAPSH